MNSLFFIRAFQNYLKLKVMKVNKHFQVSTLFHLLFNPYGNFFLTLSLFTQLRAPSVSKVNALCAYTFIKGKNFTVIRRNVKLNIKMNFDLNLVSKFRSKFYKYFKKQIIIKTKFRLIRVQIYKMQLIFISLKFSQKIHSLLDAS